MKKIYFLLVFAIIFGFAMGNKAKAECPPGWFEHWNEVTYTYTIGNATFYCNVWVNFCCRWNPETHQPEIILKNGGVAQGGFRDCLKQIYDDPARWQDYLTFLYRTVIDLAKADPSCFPVCPPCDGEPALFFTLKVSQCIKWVSRPAIVTHDGHILEWVNYTEGCDPDNYCLYTYACCTDWNNPSLPTHIWLVSVQDYGTPQCTTTRPEIPPPGKDWNESWETECFAEPCQSH